MWLEENTSKYNHAVYPNDFWDVIALFYLVYTANLLIHYFSYSTVQVKRWLCRLYCIWHFNTRCWIASPLVFSWCQRYIWPVFADMKRNSSVIEQGNLILLMPNYPLNLLSAKWDYCSSISLSHWVPLTLITAYYLLTALVHIALMCHIKLI